MSEDAFLNESNVFELFGLDFMLDEHLNLWFIECNASPQMIGTSPAKEKFLTKLNLDIMEIMIKYYRSRLKRIFDVLKPGDHNTEELYAKYAKAALNRLEPEYEIHPDNGFKKIMDKNMLGANAYYGYLPDECVDD